MPADALTPIGLSLRVALAALLVVAPTGLVLAWVQARAEYPLRRVVDALVLAPLVMPPSVIGYLLVVLLGRKGALGELLDHAFGIRLMFTPAAAVIASAVVAFPIFVKTAQPAIEAVPVALEDVAGTLGLAPLEVVLRVTLPVAWRGILAGLVLAFARALGEFGATLMFAGDVPGRTNTMPLEILTAYQTGNERLAALYVTVLTVLSLVVVLFASQLSPPRRAR